MLKAPCPHCGQRGLYLDESGLPAPETVCLVCGWRSTFAERPAWLLEEERLRRAGAARRQMGNRLRR